MGPTQTDFERRVTTFSTEIFQLAEWVAVIAAFVIAGRKLDAPLAEGFGYALWLIASLHVGIKADNLVAYARYRDKPREFSKFGMLYTVVVGGIFGLGVGELIRTMMFALA